MHANHDRRSGFAEWLDAYEVFEAELTDEVFENDEGETVAVDKLIGRVYHCTDVLPSDYCALLDLPQGSTYAKAARALKELRRGA